MKGMENDKSPQSVCIPKESWVNFSDHIKATLIYSLRKVKESEELSISQKQAVINLIEKKDRHKRYIKNRRPISLLNIDIEILCKELSKNFKKVLSCMTSVEQTV